MTPLTPETLPRHELVGLQVAVKAADNPDLLDVEGEVVAETTGTLTVESAGADRVWQVPKAGTTFAFDLPGTEAPADRGTGGRGRTRTRTRVVVEGRRLVARPARRTETTGDNTWR